MKYGFHIKKKQPDYQKLAEEFADPQKSTNTFGLPDRITRELTLDEMIDLKKVFDMFDVSGAGYVNIKFNIYIFIYIYVLVYTHFKMNQQCPVSLYEPTKGVDSA